MPLTLNTSHPLYSNIVAFICVDDDNIVKDLKGDSCTTDAAVVIGTGTYGRHFQTQIVSNSAKGIALTNGHLTNPASNPVGTTLIVINSGNSRHNRGTCTDTPISGGLTVACYTGDVAGCQSFSNNPTALGATDLIGTGAHCIAAAWNGAVEHKTDVDGSTENTVSSSGGNPSDAAKIKYIGGSSGGFGAFAANYVYYIHFRKYLTEAELDEIYASLGANNQISLLNSGGGGTPPTGTVTIGTIVPSSTGAVAPFTYSAADQTGFEYQLNETGTIYPISASPATPTGLTSSTPYTIRVRAKNASGESAWSASAPFTTSAAVAAITFTGTIPAQPATVGVPFVLDVAPYFLGTLTPFTFAILSGTLPAGLSRTGSVISGTPTTPVAAPIVVRATDSALNTADTNSFTITVSSGDVTAPTFTVAPAVTSVTQTGGTATATINETGSIFYVIVPQAQATPSVAQVIAGQNASGTAPIDSGSAVNTTTLSDAFIGLTAGAAYKACFAARDDEATPNVQSSVTVVNFNAAAAPVGTITITDIANNTNTPWASTAVDAATVMPLSLGSVVVNKTGLSTTAGADLVITDAAIATGTEYIIILKIGTAYGWYRAVAT